MICRINYSRVEMESSQAEDSNIQDTKKSDTKAPEGHSFTSIYLEACKLTNDVPEYLTTYQELDRIMAFIESHPERDKILHAMSPKRICMVIPYQMFSDKRIPSDQIINDEEVIYACIGFEHYRSILVNLMVDTALMSQNCLQFYGNLRLSRFPSPKFVVLWKLKRIAKVLSIGWDAFRTGYLEELRNV